MWAYAHVDCCEFFPGQERKCGMLRMPAWAPGLAPIMLHCRLLHMVHQVHEVMEQRSRPQWRATAVLNCLGRT
jgi:hypothetical protein